MKHDFACAPNTWHGKPLVFTWDDVTGEVTGPDAKKILNDSMEPGVITHPYPTYWEFDGGAGDGQHIKSRRTLALIIGYAHALPEDLAEFYPQAPTDGCPDVSYTDAEGVFVMGRDMMVN